MLSPKRILEFACVMLQYFTVILGGFNGSTIFVIYLLFTPLCPAVLIYLVWTILDWNVHSRGGRDLGAHFMRRLTIFKYIRDYYPINLIKTAELDPQKNYIFGYHPHGALCEGAAIGFATEALGFSKMFPGITPHLTVIGFALKSLLYRDLLMSLGVISVSRQSLEYVLTRKGPGHSAVIIVGGAAEMLEIHPGTYNFILQKRKGFVRLALETGSPLVPVFAFGQNDTHTMIGNRRGTWFGDLQRKIYARWKMQVCICHGWYGFPVPRRTPINVVVGAPIPVEKITGATQQQVENLHSQYVEKLKELFQENRDKFGVPASTQMNIY